VSGRSPGAPTAAPTVSATGALATSERTALTLRLVLIDTVDWNLVAHWCYWYANTYHGGK